MRKALWVGLGVVLFLGIFMMTRDRDMSPEISVGGSSFIEGVRILQKKNGETIWDLSARRADFRNKGDKADLKDIRIMIQEKGVVLHADAGIYDLSDKTFMTQSDVTAEGKEYKIVTDSIDFDVASGNIRSEGKVHVKGKSFAVEGKGLRVDPDEKVRILNDVKATFNE